MKQYKITYEETSNNTPQTVIYKLSDFQTVTDAVTRFQNSVDMNKINYFRLEVIHE